MLLPDLYQFFPHLDHCKGIQLAVFEQVVARCLLVFGRHVLDLWEYAHGFTAVVDAVEVVIVQSRVIREDRGEDALDRE